jgi:hypothetical protein
MGVIGEYPRGTKDPQKKCQNNGAAGKIERIRGSYEFDKTKELSARSA